MSIVHSAQARPPSIDRVLNWIAVAPLLAAYGREPVLAGVRSVLEHARLAARQGNQVDYAEPVVATHLAAHLAQHHAPRLRRVFNLSGTVLHTNLGRAPLPDEAVDALVMAARHPCALEYDLETGGRCKFTGEIERFW
jgi:L-seryl-tRNA(Ser) seleniumtransferase